LRRLGTVSAFVRRRLAQPFGFDAAATPGYGMAMTNTKLSKRDFLKLTAASTVAAGTGALPNP